MMVWILVSLIMMFPGQARDGFAQGHHRRDWHWHYPYGFKDRHYWCYNYGNMVPVYTTINILPSGYVPVVIEGETYYYNKGIFYRLDGRQLVVTAPSIGAVVPNIPTGYTTEVADDVTYEMYNGVYYRHVIGGYKVVAPPLEEGQE